MIVDLNFNPRATNRFISVLRETYEFAKFGKHAILSEEETPEEIPNGDDDSNGDSGEVYMPLPPSESNSNVQENVTKLISGGHAILRVPDPLSEQDYEYIKSWLEFLKPAIVSGSTKKVNGND